MPLLRRRRGSGDEQVAAEDGTAGLGSSSGARQGATSLVDLAGCAPDGLACWPAG